MNAIIYVNAPFTEEEHAALAELAKGNGRAKGQELRALAVSRLNSIGLLKPSIRITSVRKTGKKRGAAK